MLIGVHSRLKRAYYRLDQKYTELGWICPSCLHFYLDYEAYVKDYNRIFETNWTVDDLKDREAWMNVHIEKIEKLRGKTETYMSKIRASQKRLIKHDEVMPDLDTLVVKFPREDSDSE